MKGKHKLTYGGIVSIADECKFMDYSINALYNSRGQIYVQGSYWENDVVTGKPELQKTRKWILSEYMTKSEIVQTIFKMCLTSMEHRTREHFLYKGQRVFSPHYDVEALVELCEAGRFDEREDWYKEDE